MALLIELLSKATIFLRSKNIERPKCDAEWLFAHVLGCTRLELYLRHRSTIDGASEARFRELLLRRGAREPLQYILGEVDFCDVRLKVNANVLIPRSETEWLVEWLMDYIKKHFPDALGPRSELAILDLGTGSGAIAIALAKKFPGSRIFGIDRSPLALKVARENMYSNGIGNVRFGESDWYDILEKRGGKLFDIIVSNPPYLSQEEFDRAQDEIRKYEPREALVAPNEGLGHVETILKGAPRFLKPNGIVALETAASHPQWLQKKYGEQFRRTEILRDLNKYDRFFIAQT
ncbi:MAG: peptide chain release factor N(5)-glutamine methyltransferase [Puniceicoccales bacterium]|jgi:release factor glutamine methyltransferase|nr:peptide chain release factor N(5)-glutamine methyltransferase [Puniceicoccales bacterium]